MHPLTFDLPSRPTSREEVTHAHERAEQLLAEAENCADPGRTKRLRQESVLCCVDLADAVAHRYRDRGIELEDLVQVARMGLVKAASRYRSGAGDSFAAYAVPTISGEVKRHFRDAGWVVRPPRRLQERGAELVSADARLQQRLGRPPTREELAHALGVTADDVAEAQQSQSGFSVLSLDAPSPRETPVGDAIPDPHDEYEGVDRRDALRRAVAALDDRQRRILYLRFVEDRTQTQIGNELGVTQMQISRLLSAILSRLHEDLERADLEAVHDAARPGRFAGRGQA